MSYSLTPPIFVNSPLLCSCVCSKLIGRILENQYFAPHQGSTDEVLPNRKEHNYRFRTCSVGKSCALLGIKALFKSSETVFLSTRQSISHFYIVLPPQNFIFLFLNVYINVLCKKGCVSILPHGILKMLFWITKHRALLHFD